MNKKLIILILLDIMLAYYIILWKTLRIMRIRKYIMKGEYEKAASLICGGRWYDRLEM